MKKPLAIVVVSGMPLAPLLILIILPVLIVSLARRDAVPAEKTASSVPAE
jgi:heavy metal efflux system protein